MPTGMYKRKHPATQGHRVGDKRSPTYNSWRAMMERCRNPKFKRFGIWGGRGITICERWLTFVNFLADMGECPNGMTIERIDNNGNYEPVNCRWATRKEQRNNRRDSILIEIHGRRMNTVEWSAVLGLAHKVVAQRLRRGWNREDAVTTPPLRGSRTREWYDRTKPQLT